jgi:hypothetical protein
MVWDQMTTSETAEFMLVKIVTTNAEIIISCSVLTLGFLQTAVLRLNLQLSKNTGENLE